ncbi:Conserved hypothetical protein [Prochlorococcus marinus str. NATL2A]|uniref:Uncharacterized protein n=1 Tax=Prochlorococcus marinus (strain NATL2A) TaxID=59920 RepID=A7MDU2_PROMT|nr:Conserved hypothetical protein [Prochlorococcus marinus str. NATL2A]
MHLDCFLEQLDTLLQLEKWLKCSAGKGSRTISFDLIPDTKTCARAKTFKKTGWQTCL